MIVHLVGSLRQTKIDAPYLYQIVEAIHDHGAILAHNWLDMAIANRDSEIATTNQSAHVEAELDNVKRADVIIADLTHYSFSQGYIVAAALQYKKPILAVSRSPIDNNVAGGITNPLFTYRAYANTADLKHVVDGFLEKNTVHTKDLRFNMFLTRHIFKYLEETSRETGKSRSEIIRALVKRQAEQDRG